MKTFYTPNLLYKYILSKIKIASIIFASVFIHSYTIAQTALDFDGVNDYVSISNNTTTSFTIEAWINTSTASATGTFAYEGSGLVWSDVGGVANDFVLSVLNNKISFWDGHANQNTIGTTNINDGTWHHIAVVREAGVSVRIYVDGALQATGGVGTSALTANPNLSIGGNTLDNRYFRGKIDELRIWNVARTQIQIQGARNFCLTETHAGLIGYYQFEDGAGSATASDKTANANNGTLTNMNTTSAWVTSGFNCLPPGNSLAFDGSNDQVTIPNTASLTPASTLTVEAWVYIAANQRGNIVMKGNYGWGIIIGATGCSAGNKINYWVDGSCGNSITSTGSIPLGAWTHIAVVVTTSPSKSLQFYINGQDAGSSTSALITINNGSNLNLKLGVEGTNCACNYFNGRMDELRIWNAARTQTEIQNNMFNVINPASANLEAYYRFDLGTSAGANTGITTLYDWTSNGHNGTLSNFSLVNGNTTSNWMESYAMVVPTANAATSIGGNGFTVNWTASPIGVANNYLLDIATDAAFTSFAPGYNGFNAGSGTSFAATGLNPITTYYYRLRSNKTAIPNQGMYSNTITVTTTKADQTINFPVLPVKTYGDVDFSPGATASSGLPVSYSSSNTSVATIVGGNIHIVNSGTCTIFADQAGNASYNAAPQVSQTITVNKATLTVTADDKSKIYNTPNPPLTNAITGFVNGETIADLTTQPTASTTATTSSNVGTYPITPSGGTATNYTFTYVNGTLTINKANQTISFPAIPAKSYGNPNFDPGATASSGLSVTYSTSDPSVAIIVANKVQITGTGTCTIFADQAGNGNYNAAPQVGQTLTVGKGNQTITFNTLPVKTYTNPDFSIAAYASASSGLTVTFSSSDPSVATIVGGNTIHIEGAGQCLIYADQAGDANYNPAPQVSRTFLVAKAANKIIFNAVPTKYVTDPPFYVTATATDGVVSFTGNNPAVATVASDGLVTPVSSGYVTIFADQSGSANYQAATTVSRTIFISKLSNSINFAAIPNKSINDPSFALSATATSGNTVVFTVTQGTSIASVFGNMVTLSGTASGTVTIKATEPGDATYSAAVAVSKTFKVLKDGNVITFPHISNVYITDPDFNLNATASSGLPVSYTITAGTGIASLSGNTISLSGTANGKVTVKATQAGNTTFAAATPVYRSFTVYKNENVITFPPVPLKYISDPDFVLTATASSGLPVSYTVISGATIASVSGSTVSLSGTATGIVKIRATQAGNATFKAASSVVVSFSVMKNPNIITATTVSDKLTTSPDFNLSATASSGLPVSYTVIGGTNIVSLSGNTVSILGNASGKVTIRLFEAGDAMYSSAQPVYLSFYVIRDTQTITWTGVADKVTNDAPFAVSATSNSGLPVTISVAYGPASISGGTVTLNGNQGIVKLKAYQAGNTTYQSVTEYTTFYVSRASLIAKIGMGEEVTTSTTDFNTNSELAVVSIFPNPSDGTFNITGNKLINNLIVYDMIGNVVLINNGISDYVSTVDLTNKASGIYYFSISTADENIFRKVILK
jgi:hypothetical protein